MKAATLPSLAAIALALLLSGCDKQATPEPAADVPAPAATTPAEPVDLSTSTEKAEPTTVAADAVIVGSALGPDQAAISPKPAYAAADTVYASASAAGRAGAIARVYWTYQDGTSDKEEEKPVAGDIVNFSFSQADGMQPGAYNVQIDIDDVPVGIADFQVQ